MCNLKKRITIITYMGLVPFYISPIAILMNHSYAKYVEILSLSHLYAALIIAFISGMQWQRMIIEKQKKLLILPLLPLLLALTYKVNFFINYSSLILMFSMFLSLLIDIRIHRKINEKWFRNLRITATFLASISFLI